MADMENLEAARKFLKTSLERSSAIASALDESESRLELLNQRFQSLEAALRPVSIYKCSFVDIGDHIDSAIYKCSFVDIGDHIDSVLCSAAAALRVFNTVHQLENSLCTDPNSDLCSYVSDTKKLEEALKLLTNNCRLAVGWLQDIFEFLQGKEITVTNELCLSNVRKSLRILQELEVMEQGARLDGGLLTSAYDKLEIEFLRLLKANMTPLPLVSLSLALPIGQQAGVVGTQALPASVTVQLQAIIERLNANDRLDRCKSIYVEVRGMNARTSLKALDLSYLEIPTAEFEDLHVIESYIDQWGRHLELVVNHLLEMEYRLTSNVFEKIGSDVWMGCFAKIATESEILSFLQFGVNVSQSKNDPIKLLKLLDIFRVLNGLRLKFNQLFSGKACEDIRTVAKDLINGVVNGANEIFWELPAQVKLLRPSSPPTDGSVPRAVKFVTDYCNQLLRDTYRPHLTQVLEIHLSRRKEVYDSEECVVFTQIYNIIKELAVNLDAWSKAYEDITLSYLFMMNNHCHFYNLWGTPLGNLMGDCWLRAHERYKDYYAALILREGDSWAKVVAILTVEKELVTSQYLVKRLNAFNLAFDERYRKQSNWAITDEMLRENICMHLVEVIVPRYRAYVKKYSLSIDSDIKYSAQSLENMIRSLFQPKPREYGIGRIKQADLISKIKQVSNQFRLTLTAL